MEIDSLRSDVMTRETASRFCHTCGVYDECIYLGTRAGFRTADLTEIGIAALLHDIAKDLPADEQILLCGEAGTEYTELPTLHQDIGGYYAEKLYGTQTVTPRVRRAIECHTTGRDDMTVFDMVLFVADFTEAGRKYDTCKEMREYLHAECGKISATDTKAVEKLITSVTLKILSETIAHLTDKGAVIDLRTVSAYNSLTARENKER
ncbi:MAG: HD domain-containing protein [Clostridia bacterium]|nr:HD domain-containing protein [Clostridia bacterium]